MASLMHIRGFVAPKTAILNWAIDDSARDEYSMNEVKSPEFSPPNSEDKFELAFLPAPWRPLFKLTYIGPYSEASFYYSLSVLDANGDKRHTQENRWNYQFSFDSNWIYILFEPSDLPNQFFVNGSLKVHCEVDILGDKSVTSLPPSQIESFDKLSENYESLLKSGKFSDFIVQVGDKEFRVHKSILDTRSAVFEVMFEHYDSKEVREGRVVIEDVAADVFEQLIRYIYTGKVDGLGEHADELLAAADKYQLDHLKFICEQSLITQECIVESVSGILLLSDMHNAAQLKSKCTEYIVKHSKEVMLTDGWKELANANRDDLVAELLAKFNQD